MTLTATVADVAPATGVPTGTVTFTENGTVSLGTATLSSGSASLTLSPGLFLGTYSITASYSGDAQSAVSTSTSLTETITMPTTTTSDDGLQSATIKSGSGPALRMATPWKSTTPGI